MVDPAKFLIDVRTMTSLEVIRKYITFGNCSVFKDDEFVYYRLKRVVSEKWHIHPSNVLVVGSGKLGFSIAPRKFLRQFSETSDLDVAIVSPELFDRYWRSLYDYSLTTGSWQKRQEFAEYLFQGWIRPDKFPFKGRVQEADGWWDFFHELTASQEFGPYKIRGGLYRDWHFLESYQKKCIDIQKRIMEVKENVRKQERKGDE